MPWGDKAVSPVVYTPAAADAAGWALDAGIELIDGRIGKLAVSRVGLVVELVPANYALNAGGIASWANTGSWGGAAVQATEGSKPAKQADYIDFSASGYGVQGQFVSFTPSQQLSVFTIVLAVSLFSKYDNRAILIYDQNTASRPILSSEGSAIKQYGNGSNASISVEVGLTLGASKSFISFASGNSGTGKLKINSATQSGNLAPFTIDTSSAFVLGARYSGVYGICARVHFFGIYDRVLSDVEMAAMKTALIELYAMPSDTL